MDIRKIAVGPDYKSGAMHYIVGQSVLGNTAVIHLIKYVESEDAFKFGLNQKTRKKLSCGKVF